jgi:hypothetical protein
MLAGVLWWVVSRLQSHTYRMRLAKNMLVVQKFDKPSNVSFMLGNYKITYAESHLMSGERCKRTRVQSDRLSQPKECSFFLFL